MFTKNLSYAGSNLQDAGRAKGIDHSQAILALFHDPRLEEHREMARHVRPLGTDVNCDVAHTLLAVLEVVDDRQADRMSGRSDYIRLELV